MKTHEHNVKVERDPDGRTVIGIKLSNRDHRAWLYAADYERVIRANGGSWFANRGDGPREYVRATNPETGSPVMVSRLITGAGPRDRIRLRDGNPLNLRRTNLEVVSGRQRSVLKVARRDH